MCGGVEGGCGVVVFVVLSAVLKDETKSLHRATRTTMTAFEKNNTRFAHNN